MVVNYLAGRLKCLGSPTAGCLPLAWGRKGIRHRAAGVPHSCTAAAAVRDEQLRVSLHPRFVLHQVHDFIFTCNLPHNRVVPGSLLWCYRAVNTLQPVLWLGHITLNFEPCVFREYFFLYPPPFAPTPLRCDSTELTLSSGYLLLERESCLPFPINKFASLPELQCI